MLGGISYNEDNVQQGEPSTGTEEPSNLNRGKKRQLESENTNNNESTEEPSNLNKGKKRQLVSENSANNESTGTSQIYPCIEIEMIKFRDKDLVSLSFDADKLSTEGEKYLEEICVRGRSVLFEHYSVRNLMEARNLVDHITFEDISITEESKGNYNQLFEAFYKKNKDIIDLHSLKLNEIYPFSKLYLDGNLDYSEEDDSRDSGNSTEVVLNKLKDFEPREIDSLINILRIKQMEFLYNEKNTRDVNKSCVLHDIGFRCIENVVRDKKIKNNENDITRMLTKLLEVKPDFFLNRMGSRKPFLEDTSVNAICSRLELFRGKVLNDLTKEDIHTLIKELKSRLQKLLEYKKSENKKFKVCTFKDIHITSEYGVILDQTDKKLNNEFTLLLDKLVYNKPEVFNLEEKDKNNFFIQFENVKQTYSKISDLIRKPLTRDEINLIIDGLEFRKENLFEFRRTINNTDKTCRLKDFKL